MNTANITPLSTPPGLPLVVQLGFAGSRFLFDPNAHSHVAPDEFHEAVERHLTERLRKLPPELGLSDRHFFCGLSQLAIGADTLFTHACRELGWPQRLCLPQQREDFLGAVGSDGTPDFTDAQRLAALALFASPHIIQERVVSDSTDRHTRFQDVNLELAHVSDLVVCLVDATAAGQAGGTRALIDDANERQRPLLEIRVGVGPDTQAQFDEVWHHRDKFTPPALPVELSGLRTDLTGIPAATDYCQPLKDFASHVSKLKQTSFKITALVIIGTHVLATGCAVLALRLHGAAALPWLLGVELLLLVLGLGTHVILHGSKTAHLWAMARLVAEIARSGLALRYVSGYLGHLFSLPLPAALRPLLRTLSVLHLRETRTLSAASWQGRRNSYVETRLKGGQIPYYEKALRNAKFRRAVARYAFFGGSGFAIVATLGKLLLVCDCLPVPAECHDGWAAGLGTLAIVLPVVAVAALSLAASFDLEARFHTYREMLDSLRTQQECLNNATSERAFSSLALETEARLLGETASWYSRRAFTGVT